MTYTLSQLGDMETIRLLKHRYFRGIDTADMALLAGLFTPDVSVDYRGGTYRVRISGRDDMLEFLANIFHSGVVAMHHGHMPEITLTSEAEADGVWYLEDIFIDIENRLHTAGTAIYRDRYRREADGWRIAHTEYDRIYEIVSPLDDNSRITVHHLARAGRQPHERRDISHLIEWDAA